MTREERGLHLPSDMDISLSFSMRVKVTHGPVQLDHLHCPPRTSDAEAADFKKLLNGLGMYTASSMSRRQGTSSGVPHLFLGNYLEGIFPAASH